MDSQYLELSLTTSLVLAKGFCWQQSAVTGYFTVSLMLRILFCAVTFIELE